MNCSQLIYEPIKNSSINIFFLFNCSDFLLSLFSILIVSLICFVSYKIKPSLSILVFSLLGTSILINLYQGFSYLSQYIITLLGLILIYAYINKKDYSDKLFLSFIILSFFIHEFGFLLLLFISFWFQKKENRLYFIGFGIVILALGYESIFTMMDPQKIFISLISKILLPTIMMVIISIFQSRKNYLEDRYAAMVLWLVILSFLINDEYGLRLLYSAFILAAPLTEKYMKRKGIIILTVFFFILRFFSQ